MNSVHVPLVDFKVVINLLPARMLWQVLFLAASVCASLSLQKILKTTDEKLM